MTAVLVKVPRDIHSLWQAKFLMAVNLFISRPSHKPLPRTTEKNSGERSLILKIMEYNMLPRLLSS